MMFLLVGNLAFALTGCSDAPSDSTVKNLIQEQVAEYREEAKVNVESLECEPTSTEGQYDCSGYIEIQDGDDKAGRTESFRVNKANGEWFLKGL